MNKVFNFLLAFFFSALLLVSCEKEPILEVSQSSLTFTDQGGAQTISFSTNKDWTVSVSGGTGWCTISPSSGKSEIRSISVTVEANTTYDDRTATITINAEELSKVITISQPKNRAIMLTKDSFEVGSTGGNISVELSSNVEYDVAIPTENQSWITNTTTKGLVTSTLTFAIAPNGTYDSRTGKIIIKDKTTALADTVHVMQTQKDAIILTNKTFNVADTLIVISVELKSNVTYMVTIPSAAQLWIKQLQTKALKTENLQFEIARNTAFLSRSAEIIIIKSLTTLADTLIINQAKAPNVPTASTYDPYDITASSVKTGGNITSDGGGEVLSRGVCWSKNENPTIESSKTTNGKGTGTFTTDITGLEPATKYYIRSYATNRTGTGYGNTVSFTTQITKPTITTVATTQVTKNSVVTGGNIISTGGGAITQRGVCWSTSENPTITGSKTTDGSGSGVFSSSITGLMSFTLYYVRAYATNSAGTSYGEQIEITTLKSEPTVETQSIKILSQNSAEVNCLIINDGGVEVTERGVCWSLNDNPTISDNKTNNGTGIGSYTAQISNLQLNSSYYVRAYAKNSIGISYGIILSLKTFGEPITDIEGNTYSTVKIGTQTWMTENLKTKKYRNGEIIETTIPALAPIWNDYEPKYQWILPGDEANMKNGRYYTWWVIDDIREICPEGWHVPNNNEWTTLINFLGGFDVAGEKLKSEGNNSSGFSAIFSGIRINSGFFGGGGYLWSKDKVQSDYFRANIMRFYNNEPHVNFIPDPKNNGIPIRCIKD